MGRASRKRAAKRAGTFVEPEPKRTDRRPPPRPRQPFSWARAKNFILYGVVVLVVATLALSALPDPWRVPGAGIAYAVATLAVIVYLVMHRGWAAMRRRVGIVGLITAGVAAAGIALALFVKGSLATNPLIGILLGLLLAGTGRTLFPPEGEPTTGS